MSVCGSLIEEDHAPWLSYSPSSYKHRTKHRFWFFLQSCQGCKSHLYFKSIHNIVVQCPEKRHSAVLNYRLVTRDIHHSSSFPSAQTSKHIRQTILQCQLSPYTLIDCQVQKVNRTVWSTTKTSGQIAGNIQEDLLRLTVGNLKLIPDSKRRQRRPKGKVKASSQFCKPEDAKEKCLPTYLSLAFPPALEK